MVLSLKRAPVIFSLILLALWGVGATGPARDQAPKSAADIFEKHFAAIGGSAVTKRNSQSYKGKITVQGLEGTIERYSKAPNKAYEKVDLKILVQESGCNGQTAWKRDQGGLRPLSGDELSHAREEALFNRYLRFKDPKVFADYQLVGTDSVGGKKAYKIKLKTPSGNIYFSYFDAANYLEVRRDYEAAVGKTKIKVQLYFGDYRKVDGITLPFEIRQVTPFNEAVIKVASYSVNQTIKDSLFEMPKS